MPGIKSPFLITSACLGLRTDTSLPIGIIPSFPLRQAVHNGMEQVLAPGSFGLKRGSLSQPTANMSF